MMPAPGFQKPIPYFFAADARKLYTSLFSSIARSKSFSDPISARIRWSQWIVLGTAAFFLFACMNCSMAICAVASCIATRSGRSASMALPRSQICVSKLSACETRIFSASVNARPNFSLAFVKTSGILAYSFLARSIDIEVHSFVVLSSQYSALFQRRHFPPFGRRIVHQVIEQPDQAAVLALLIHPVADQSDCPGQDEESVQTVHGETDIHEHGGHCSVHVQNQVVLLCRRHLFNLECEIEAGRLDVQALHITDQFLHSLVRIAKALHPVSDTGNR